MKHFLLFLILKLEICYTKSRNYIYSHIGINIDAKNVNYANSSKTSIYYELKSKLYDKLI